MKRIVYIVGIILATATFTSCGTTSQVPTDKNEIAGYTLKCKKELMQQKIANTPTKKIIVAP